MTVAFYEYPRKTTPSLVELTEEQVIGKAIERYRSRCRRNGAVYQEPSRSDCVVDYFDHISGDDCAYVQLRNVNGLLACYQVMPSGRFYWCEWEDLGADV